MEQLSREFSASVRIDHEEFYERKPLNFEISRVNKNNFVNKLDYFEKIIKLPINNLILFLLTPNTVLEYSVSMIEQFYPYPMNRSQILLSQWPIEAHLQCFDIRF